jgi:alkanesulfonate monooxygenase SsuD/methylene tetrahydromethanopterin reductase-like flavin-dependent oxidoreductase (luciferase family)
MSKNIQFGLRLAEFPVDQSSGVQFRDQLFAYLDGIHEHFVSAWVADHFFPWLSSLDQSVDTFEAIATISYLMARYPTLKIGSIVLSQGYRQPALLAKMGSTLQTLSNGRFILGIGAGWKENEYRAYGYEYPSTGVRLAQLAEAVQVIRKMWTEEQPAFQGKYYQIENAYCKPRFDPAPPLLIGGGGKQKTLRIVAEHADWWNFPGGSPEHYQDLLNTLREHCQAVGRDEHMIVKTWLSDCVAVAASSQEAEQLAQASPLNGSGTVKGTPNEVAAHLQRFVDLGVTHFMLRFADFPKTEGALLFAKEVLPRFQ